MKRKILSTLVVVLLIGLALAPSINADVNKEDDLVELDVEFCGLGRKHTVKLTQEEYSEVELIFDDMQGRLSVVESDNVAVDIFNEAIVKLDDYGLLGDVSVNQAQRFFSNIQRLMDNNLLQRIVSSKTLDDNENMFCFIIGKIDNIDFCRRIFLTNFLIDSYYLHILFHFMVSVRSPIFNLRSYISVTHYFWEHEGNGAYYISDGIILTLGLNGFKKWDGALRGDLYWINIGFGLAGYVYNIGVEGFFGVQLTNLDTDDTNFFGFAKHVKIDYW